MTDLEITRACAEAMGDLMPMVEHGGEMRFGYASCLGPVYRPLHDDAQAMALVKKFRLYVDGHGDLTTPLDSEKYWSIEYNDGYQATIAERPDLNRAICECVAKMQAKVTP